MNAKDEAGLTALHYAATQGSEACVRMLIDARADVNAKEKDEGTALHHAAEQGNGACVQVLIGVLLNLEFFLAKWKAEVDYDVMISYRVWSDGGLAQDLYRKLCGEGLRVYLDKVCA